MDLLQPGRPLAAVKGKARVPLVDTRPPLSSPMTLVVLLLKATGFRWYGPEKELSDGRKGTSCFLDTCVKHADGTERRKVVWAFIGNERKELGGDPVSLIQIAHFFGYCEKTPERPLPRGAREVLSSILRADEKIWRDEMPFNTRGKRLLAACAAAGHKEAQLILCDVLDLYRGYCWKLSTPVGTPAHPVYGDPLERHLRYRHGKRTGDVRQSIEYDHRMDELQQLGLR